MGLVSRETTVLGSSHVEKHQCCSCGWSTLLSHGRTPPFWCPLIWRTTRLVVMDGFNLGEAKELLKGWSRPVATDGQGTRNLSRQPSFFSNTFFFSWVLTLVS